MSFLTGSELYPTIFHMTPGLDELIEELEKEDYLQKQPNKVIYHYTDANGLLGMVKNHEIWCTDIEYMNDADELNYALNLIINRINKFKSDFSDDSVFFNCLESECFTLFGEAYDVYVACFSEKKNLLSQWRGYGSYCVGFDCNSPFRTDCHANLPSEWPCARLRKVEYSRDKQVEIIDKIIMGLFSLFKEHMKNPEHDYEVIANWYSGNFANLVFEYLISFKDKTFEEEDEWRLIHLRFKGYGEENDTKFRVRDDYLIPYIKSGIRIFDETKFKSEYRNDFKSNTEDLGFDDYLREIGKFPINYVGIGPLDYLDIAKRSTEKILKQHGFENAKVETTESNIRGSF